jgi:hypothetical protein
MLCLQNTGGRDAYCRASVFRWVNESRRGNDELRNGGHPRRPYRYETDADLRSILQGDPNGSLRTISDTSSISPETIRIHILQIGDTLKSLRWITHALTSELNQVCFNLCLQLLPKLRAYAHDNWRHFVTWMRGGFITNMFGIGYGPHGMRTGLKWRTRPLPPRKLC